MDVLQLLKMEFKERLVELTALTDDAEASLGVRATLTRLKAHLSLEAGYLLPELSAISGRNDTILPRLEAELQELQLMLGRIDSQEVIQAQLEQLKLAFASHAQSIEDRILPLMRQKITTAEREELFFVLQDAKQDLMKSTSLERVM